MNLKTAMNTTETQPQGLILHLQRLSTEDGPGLRTTVFFKGCPLHCVWCHNPESISPHLQIQWQDTRCIGCRTCLEVCATGSLLLDEQGMYIDRESCTLCGLCVDACPATALELLGTYILLDDLMAELLKDRVYFDKSHSGGVTLSGGEPLIQPGFALPLLQRLKAAGIHTALDTCGMAAKDTLAKALPFTDLLLFDLKEMDSLKHLAFTGQRNERILENLDHIAWVIAAESLRTKLWIRTPLIPGATATHENIQAVGALIAALDGLVERWDLLAFNNLARDKFKRLDMHWPYGDTPLLTKAELDAFVLTARRSGVNPEIVHASGATTLG